MILERIKDYIDYKGITVAAFERSVSMSNASFGKSLRNGGAIGTDKLENILSVYPDLSTEWLLTGKGKMIKTSNSSKEIIEAGKQVILPYNIIKECKPIPLVLEKVAAGFGSTDFCIQETDVKDYYVIPKFRHFNVDFMIEVSGDSMIPYFYPGDIIACSILHDRNFIQWNRVHVIATREQGLLVKRIMPGDSADNYTAVSDNKDYPPFKIPLCDITGVALVVGSVSLE